MNQFGYKPEEYKRATESKDAVELAMLAKHPSRYIKARVAGNERTLRKTRDELRIKPEHSSIIFWMLGSPALTVEEYRQIFDEYVGLAFEPNMSIHSSLASHHFATHEELKRLLEKDRWNITLAVLNCRNRENIPNYKDLIKALLAPEGTQARDMDEIQKLAHLRYYGDRPW